MPVIGFMSARSPGDSVHLVEAFRQGLKGSGLVEGQNVTVEYRWVHGDYARLPALARGAVDRRVAVLLGNRWRCLRVASLNRPGGNVTGVYLLINDLEPKRLGLLNELVPGTSMIGALLNPKSPPVAQQAKDVREAAQTIGRQVNLFYASNDTELDAAFAALADHRAAALLSGADPSSIRGRTASLDLRRSDSYRRSFAHRTGANLSSAAGAPRCRLCRRRSERHPGALEARGVLKTASVPILPPPPGRFATGSD